MTLRIALLFLGRLFISSLAFVVGMLLGGMMAAMLTIPAPALPPEIDASATGMIMWAASPLLVLALYSVNRQLAGGRAPRGIMLFLLTWIAFSLNNVIEAVIFTSYETASWFTIVTFVPAILLSALAVAWLFPGHTDERPLRSVWRRHFQQRPGRAWTWRLLVAAVIFAPIYYLFGMLVVPLVGDYYAQGAFGLTTPPLPTLLAVLLGRSLLFLIACLPVIVAWQGTRIDLWLNLGFALFVLVGLIYMLAGIWLPGWMRLIHTLEILADSLLYAGALTWLLAIDLKNRTPAVWSTPTAGPTGQVAS